MGCVDGDKSYGPRGAPGRPPPNKGKPYPIEILISDTPLLAEALEAARFRHAPNPGHWLRPDGDYLMVPEALAGPGRGSTDLGVHGREAARRSRGLEVALVDRQAITLAALEPEDGRNYELWAAGPSALPVTKVTTIDERTGAVGRGVDKDALDVSRLLRAVATDDLVAGVTTLADDELSAVTAQEAIDAPRRLFGASEAEGIATAVRAAMPLVG